ncbi:MAG: hypothetical protein ACI91F_002005, partial [Candidatus Binatia bacterium]
VIVAQVLTDAAADDAKTGLHLIEETVGKIASVTADAAYDTVAIYEAARARGAKVVVPPIRTARVTRQGPRSAVRDRTIGEVARIGRRQWQKESGYHLQGRVENTFPVQRNHRRPAARPSSECAGDRDRDRLQHPEPDGLHWDARFQGGEELNILRAGEESRFIFDSCTNAPNTRPSSSQSWPKPTNGRTDLPATLPLRARLNSNPNCRPNSYPSRQRDPSPNKFHNRKRPRPNQKRVQRRRQTSPGKPQHKHRCALFQRIAGDHRSHRQRSKHFD